MVRVGRRERVRDLKTQWRGERKKDKRGRR